VNFLRVLDELRTQQQLQRGLLSAQGQLVQDRIDLYLALGGTWELQRPEVSARDADSAAFQ
jgi:outer membrane protein TolC